jgi:hypothetical protein
MEIFKIVAPFIGVLLGFSLAQFGEFFKGRKEKKKTLKKLLFNLLELNHVLDQEYDFENSISKFMNKFLEKFPKEQQEQAKKELPMFVDYISANLKENFINSKKVTYLEENIDAIISELSEIYPLFAFELNGQYKVKERLRETEDYFNKVSEITEDEFPVDIKDWITPKITSKLIDRLQDYILAISKSIGKSTHKEVKNGILKKEDSENPELDKFLNEYYEKIQSLDKG